MIESLKSVFQKQKSSSFEHVGANQGEGNIDSFGNKLLQNLRHITQTNTKVQAGQDKNRKEIKKPLL